MSDDKRSSLIRFNRSIRVQLLVGTVIILAAVVLLATTLIARNATQTLERQFSAQVSQLASQSARTVADFIDARSATVDLWAADTLLISVVRDPGLSAVFLPGLARYLASYAEREPWIGDVLLVKEGQALFSLAGMEGWKGQDALIAKLAEAPPGDMILVDRGTTRQLAIRRQTVDRGVPMDQVYVFLLLDLAVAQDRLLEDASPGQTGFAALYDPAGTLVTPTQGAIPAFATITDPQANGHSGYLIEARPVPSAPLHVVVAADRTDIDAPVRRLVLFSVLFGAAAILVGLTAMIYFTGRVTAPIRQLSSDARREALARFGLPNSPAGRAAAQIEYGEDEVGELAAVFALLGRTTDELTNANAQLESRNLELNDSRRLLRVNLDRLERELDSARILQLSMVPKPNALLGRQESVRIACLMKPAREVGGDFYDYFPVDDSTICFLIGDVSDKGTPSALFMARTVSLLRFAVTEALRLSGKVPTPSEVFEQVNTELCKSNPTRMFVTLFLGFLNTKSGAVSYANAGHVVSLHGTSRRMRPIIERNPDLPLGVSTGARFQTQTCTLTPSDRIVCYTDGVTEAENLQREQFGLHRLLAAADATVDAPPEAIVARVCDEIAVFAEGTEQFDDITLLVLGWEPMGTRGAPL